MTFESELEKIRVLVETGNSEKALAAIEKLRNSGCEDSILILFEALAKYDAGDDLQCLKYMRNFLHLADNKGKHNYALFISAICLMNLGLASEARSIFSKLPDNYPDIEKELRKAEETESIQRKALSYFIKITGSNNA